MIAQEREGTPSYPVPKALAVTPENELLYTSVDSNFSAVFEYVKKNDLSKLNPGKYEVSGKDVYLLVVENNLKDPTSAKYEVHDLYTDVQFPINQTEGFGYKAREECRLPEGKPDPENDISFFNDTVKNVILVKPNQFIVFTPKDAHATMIGEGVLRVAVFKVRYHPITTNNNDIN
jgi:YhcH/YjgK/YiaL family protein